MLRSAAIALLLIVLAGMVTTVVVRSQSQTADVEVRVRAKRLADGRTEFVVQLNDWSESLFSSNPKLTADPVIDRWYNSVIASVDVDAVRSAAAMLRRAIGRRWAIPAMRYGSISATRSNLMS